MLTHVEEVRKGKRFRFGKNWSMLLTLLNEDRIMRAEMSIKTMLQLESLEGLTFLDIGSGSGLFSLAARRLGATVYSFDYDSMSVACTMELKKRYFPEDSGWRIGEGSVLDSSYLALLGKFDIVYSWGVLHHTGKMRDAIDNAHKLVNEQGLLFISAYNYQVYWTRIYTLIKNYTVLQV